MEVQSANGNKFFNPRSSLSFGSIDQRARATLQVCKHVEASLFFFISATRPLRTRDLITGNRNILRARLNKRGKSGNIFGENFAFPTSLFNSHSDVKQTHDISRKWRVKLHELRAGATRGAAVNNDTMQILYKTRPAAAP